jgi:hypothetical protein
MRIRPLTLLARISVVCAVGCASDPEPRNDSAAVETTEPEPCTPESACRGCGSCAALCACSGGSASECESACAGDPEEPLPPPEVTVRDGRYAVTLVTEEFEVPPGGEAFRCQNFSNPFGRHVAVVESRSVMASGSHHMFVFQGTSFSAGRLQHCGGLEFGGNIHSSQRSEESVVYPDGIGRILFAEEGLRVQAHYLNTTREPITAYVAVTLEAVDPGEVEALAAQVFINTFGISIPPQGPGSAQNSCAVPHEAKLLTASSHMHQFGTYFEARTSDGQLIFETTEWAEPTPWRFDPPLALEAGSQIHIRCEYLNTTDMTLTFGESAATNEMCILSGLYYPAPNGASITCLF